MSRPLRSLLLALSLVATVATAAPAPMVADKRKKVVLRSSHILRAPVVVAKGVDETALAIRELAQAHRIAVVEAPPLARALYRQAQVDQEIPVKLYAAVAQVLSYVYQLRAWAPGRGPMPALAPLDAGPEGAVDYDPHAAEAIAKEPSP